MVWEIWIAWLIGKDSIFALMAAYHHGGTQSHMIFLICQPHRTGFYGTLIFWKAQRRDHHQWLYQKLLRLSTSSTITRASDGKKKWSWGAQFTQRIPSQVPSIFQNRGLISSTLLCSSWHKQCIQKEVCVAGLICLKRQFVETREPKSILW